jgi:ABC-2 type transport system ATP-binding protein
MNFCRGFVTDPKILYLDEPTLGLDVTAARTVRKFVRNWMDERPERTMVLTTHYLAEAEELCDRIAIIHRGKLLACDTPRALKQKVQRYPVFEMSVASPSGMNGYHHLDRVPGVKHCSYVEGPTRVDIKLSLDEESAVGAVVQELIGGGSRIISLKKVEPSLEDVFIEVVGHGTRQPEEVAA